MDKDDPKKFDRAQDLRVQIGEQVVVRCMKDLSAELLLKIKPLLEVWDTVNVFGVSDLIDQILPAVSQGNDSPAEPAPEPPTEPELDPIVAPRNNNDNDNDNHEDNFPIEDIVDTPVEDHAVEDIVEHPVVEITTQLRDGRRTSSIVDFDFEKQGIPAGKVEAREFLEPCKAVATLQITRDLRSESCVHLRSLLTSIPKEIRIDMEMYKKEWDETGEMPQVDESKIEFYSRALDSNIIDLSVEEALDNIRSFREIVKKLKVARKRLFDLLIKSRCEFGSEQAAKAFLDINELTQKLKKRRELILDAMDLEGMEPPQEKSEEPKKELEGFSWYDPLESSTKRQKVQ